MTCEGGGSLEIYLEPFLPKPQLVIVGRSPVAQTVSHLGSLLDFKVIVADPEATSESFPEADLILTDLSTVRSHIHEASYVVVATMGNGDEEGLLAVVGTRPKYLGLVASEKKSKGLFEYLLETGTTAEDIGVITCPAGIELGGETLPEIALSVAAEITRVRRTASGQPVSTTEVAIDPICGMTVDIASAKYTSVVDNKTIYFCCLRCKETFDHPQISQINRRHMRKFISGLILGAGASQRLGPPKQLLPFRGTTMLGWVVDQAQRAAGLDELVVVLGRAADEVRERVDFGAARVVENPVFGEGCSSSYRAAVAALNSQSAAIMIILGDQPGITPEIIDTLAEEWRRKDAPIALCSYRGRTGHPMIFAQTMFDQLTGLHGDKAAWKLVDANSDSVQEIYLDLPFPDNINTAEDFERLAATVNSEKTN